MLGRCNLQKNAEIQVILKTDKISRLSREWYLFLSACREYVEKINTQLDIKCENWCMTVIREVWLQEMIEQYMHWNEDIGEWQLKCVAYTGNNMRKQSPLPDKSKVCLFCWSAQPRLFDIYLLHRPGSTRQIKGLSVLLISTAKALWYLLTTQAWKQTSGDRGSLTWNYCGIMLLYNFTTAALYMVLSVTVARIVVRLFNIC